MKLPTKRHERIALGIRGPLVLIIAIGIVAGCGGDGKTTKSSPTSPLTGFGATVADWDAHHEADSRFVPGSAYDPDSSLARGGDERYTSRYYAVGDGERVTNYEMRFAPGTGVQQAKRSILASEFPSDAKIVWFKQLDTCGQMLVRSRKVARAVGGKRIAALVEFSSGEAGDSYDPSDVWGAILIALPEPVDLGC